MSSQIGVPKSFVIHLIHVTFKSRSLEIFASNRERVLLSLNPYKSSTCHRLNPEFAAIETLVAIFLNNDHVVHPLNCSLPHNRHNTGK